MTTNHTAQQGRPDAVLPAVHCATLEDLVAELAWPPSPESGQQNDFPPILRVMTQFYHLPTGPGVKYHTMKVIVTALAQPVGDPRPHTYVWVWQVDDYETWQGRVPPGSPWRLAHSHALLEVLEDAVRAWLARRTGLVVRKGMYCVPTGYHDIPGSTALFNLLEQRARVRAEMPDMPDDLLPKAHRIRTLLRAEPSCGDDTLLRLFWGEQEDQDSAEDAGTAREELQLVRAYLAFLEERKRGNAPGVADGPRFSVPTVRDLLSRGLISAGMSDLIFGFKLAAQAAEEQLQAELLRGTWERVKTIILLGESGAGKTSGAAFWLYQAALGGAWFIVIDPEGKSHDKRSLATRLGPLQSRFLMESASTEEEIAKAVELAFQILEQRSAGWLKRNSAVIVVCDEFAELMRRREPGNAYDRLAQLFEAYTIGGLKHWCFGVAMSQHARTVPAVGSEFGTLSSSVGVFRTLPTLAKLLLSEVADELMETVKKLPDGQLLLRLSGTQIVHLAVPVMGWEDMTAMGAMVDELRIPHPIYGEQTGER